MSTIKDVAHYSNVSIATVSRVINGGIVSDKTRDKVTKAIEVLGYTQNTMARALKISSCGVIGVVVNSFSDSYNLSIVQNLELALSKTGSTVFVTSSENDFQKEERSLSVFLRHSVDAVVIFPSSEKTFHIEKAVESGVPIVIVDREPASLATDVVFTAKDPEVVSDIATYIADLLLRRIQGDFSDFPQILSNS